MNKLLNTSLIFWFALVLFSSACKKDDNTSTPDVGQPLITDKGTAVGLSTTTTIGPDGGKVTSSDGILSLDIPQGALSEQTDISVQPISNEAPLGVGLGYRLTPEGTAFSVPITLTFHYTDEMLASNPAEFLWIVFQVADGSWNAMLKSTVDKNTKTVSVEATHFSDWTTGRFIDLSLNPASKSVKRNESVKLTVKGFSKPPKNDDDLAPLIPTDVTTQDYIETNSEKYFQFRVKNWTLNGVNAPVNNKFGSLAASNNSADYTAPSSAPKPNVVAVTAELETDDVRGNKLSFQLVSNITVLDNDNYLQVTFRDSTYIMYQYGLDGSFPEDPSNEPIANCALSADNILEFGGTTLTDNVAKEGLTFFFANPSVGSRSLTGAWEDGNDNVNFTYFDTYKDYSMLNITRTPGDNQTCEEDYKESGCITLTLTKYTGTMMSEVEGTFSGTLFYSDNDYEASCKSSTSYPISGEFHMLLFTAQ